MDAGPRRGLRGLADHARAGHGGRGGVAPASETDYGAHHSAGLFHLQHEVAKATGLALARAVRAGDAGVPRAEAQLADACAAEQAYRAQRHGPRLPPAFAQRIRDALATWARAVAAHARQGGAREMIRSISPAYHPYDLQRAEAQPPERLATLQAGIWHTVRHRIYMVDAMAQKQAL
jgi:hypothetical protein